MAMKETNVQTDTSTKTYGRDQLERDVDTDLADAIVQAWNTPPWSCNLDAVQQRLMARIAAKVARG